MIFSGFFWSDPIPLLKNENKWQNLHSTFPTQIQLLTRCAIREGHDIYDIRFTIYVGAGQQSVFGVGAGLEWALRKKRKLATEAQSHRDARQEESVCARPWESLPSSFVKLVKP